MELEERGSNADVPVEQSVYRTSRGLIVTSSMIARGIGAGQMMSHATELSDAEAQELAERLALIPDRTEFETKLIADIKAELGSRWV